MLQLKNIVKDYDVGDGGKVHALRGVDIEFRENEFVSILGPSGCGKTTLLNIVGGLDRYTDGDLVINGISTKDFTDADWDSYRNHTIGFVFQSYNLISHLSVLGNVELALTLSGIDKSERKQRAVSALEKVGLKEQINKRPNQLSGGQMQRVAIARALVNNPDIVLADEPTGALDTETSVQIMDLLKEVAEDRLVIMVTHNPDLAERYSSRIVRLLDGRKIDDTNPYTAETEEVQAKIDEKAAEEKAKEGLSRKQIKRRKKALGKTSMSFFTALSLSIRNLFSKKGRTTMVSFAGSIGIIGIALILSLSQGFSDYISNLEKQTLSNYPIAITMQTSDLTETMNSMMSMGTGLTTEDKNAEKYPDKDSAGIQHMMFGMIDSMSSGLYTNDLKTFKRYLEEHKEEVAKLCTVQYSYGVNVNVYSLVYGTDVNGDKTIQSYTKLNPTSTVAMDLDTESLIKMYTEDAENFNPKLLEDLKKGKFDKIMSDMMQMMGTMTMMSEYVQFNMWMEMLDDTEFIGSQYDLIAGEWSDDPNGVYLVVDQYNRIPDVTLFSLGYMGQNDLIKYFLSNMSDDDGKPYYSGDVENLVPTDVDFEAIMDINYKLIEDPSYYGTEYTEGTVYEDKSKDKEYVKSLLPASEDLYVAGVLRLKEGVSYGSLTAGGIYYTKALVDHIYEQTEANPLVQAQKANPDKNILKGGKSFEEAKGSYNENCKKLGVSDPDVPATIYMYPMGFEEKAELSEFIKTYNKQFEENAKALENLSKQKEAEAKELEQKGDLEGAAAARLAAENHHKEALAEEGKQIKYTDMVGMIIGTVTTIVDAVKYVLIAFVSISLVVSSLMIGIITCISVLERTKEIGVLRSIGASKHDISNVFNAETVCIGAGAGLFGVVITWLLNIPITLIVKHFAKIDIAARLPFAAALLLVAISIVLTLIAGIIPSRMAAKKDPVIALRSE